MELKLEGKSAVIAIVAFVFAFIGYRSFLHEDLQKNPELRRQLETSLMSEIAGDVTADSEAIREAIARGDKEEASALAEGVLRRKVTIEELAMRGSGDDVIVRAEYVVHGPTGGERKTGYFQFSHSAIAGWQYRYESSALSWHLKFF